MIKKLALLLIGTIILGLVLQYPGITENVKQAIIWLFALGATSLLFVYPELRNYLKKRKSKLEEHKKNSFELDWKWVPSDILHQVKRLVPKFTFKLEAESGPFGKKAYFRGTINGEIVELNASQDNPIEFIEKINPLIVKLVDSRFEELKTDGDYYVFILVPLK